MRRLRVVVVLVLAIAPTALALHPGLAAISCTRSVGHDVFAYGASSATCTGNSATNQLDLTAVAESRSPVVYGYPTAYGGVGGAYVTATGTMPVTLNSAPGARTVTGDYVSSRSIVTSVTDPKVGGAGYGYISVSMTANPYTCEKTYSGGGYGGGGEVTNCRYGTYVYQSRYTNCFPSAPSCTGTPLISLAVTVPPCPSTCGFQSWSRIDVTYSVMVIASSQGSARATTSSSGTVSIAGG